MPLLCPLPSHPLNPKGRATGDQDHPLLKRRSTTFNLQATRGHQRSQSSCGGGSTSPGCPRQDSMDPSDEDVGTGAGGDGCRQTLNSEHLSETLNSLSLTSLLSPGSLAPSLVKKCNSTGSLDQTNLSARSKDGRHYYGIDAHGYLSNPWTDGRARGEEEEEKDSDIRGFSMKSSSRPTDTSSRKDRWNTCCLSVVEHFNICISGSWTELGETFNSVHVLWTRFWNSLVFESSVLSFLLGCGCLGSVIAQKITIDCLELEYRLIVRSTVGVLTSSFVHRIYGSFLWTWWHGA